MDEKNVKNEAEHGEKSEAVLVGTPKAFIAFGWLFAGLAAFINPYFALGGITFGLLANRRQKSSGNYIIAANVTLGILSMILGYFGFMILGRIFGSL